MRRRKRLLTSILALAAMTFSFAETVTASVCPPSMGMEMQQVGEPNANEDGAIPAGSHDRGHGEPSEGDMDCPFGPAVTGCTGVASFPSRVASDLVPRLRADRAAFSEPTTQPLLLANALFHPPRA